MAYHLLPDSRLCYPHPSFCWSPHALSVWDFNPTSDSGFSTPPDYPESSQRTLLLSPPIPSHSSPLSDPYDTHHVHSPSRGPHFTNDPWAVTPTTLYAMDDPESSFPPRSTPPQSVKDEPDDEDCFIMELAAPPATHLSQALAPPTEVPLRATQASKEMRKMMGVFRLNPFAIHSGAGRGVVPSSWYGGEAGPLEEDPLVFEFQLDIDGAEGPSSFSPGFERGAKDEGARPQWLEAEAEAEAEAPSQHPPPGSPTWDLPYVNDYGSASDSAGAPPPDYPPRRSGRLHSTSSHPYSRRNLHHDDFNGLAAHPALEVNRMRLRRPPSATSWSAEEYVDSSRGTGFIGSSGECDLPSAMARRWSVPSANPQAPFLM